MLVTIAKKAYLTHHSRNGVPKAEGYTAPVENTNEDEHFKKVQPPCMCHLKSFLACVRILK